MLGDGDGTGDDGADGKLKVVQLLHVFQAPSRTRQSSRKKVEGRLQAIANLFLAIVRPARLKVALEALDSSVEPHHSGH